MKWNKGPKQIFVGLQNPYTYSPFFIYKRLSITLKVNRYIPTIVVVYWKQQE